MILTVVRISVLRLWHNRGELLLTFVVPLIFFSIFAWIFGSRDGDGGTPRIKVAVVDLAGSPASGRVLRELAQNRSLRIIGDRDISLGSVDDFSDSGGAATVSVLANEPAATSWVRRGMVTAAVVIQAGERDSVRAEILADSYDQVAPQVLGGVVQRAIVAAQQTVALESRGEVIPAGGAGQAAPGGVAPASAQAPTAAALLPSVPIRDVLGEDKANPIIAMYAAGIAVMFSLFSATTASGSLLEERENLTLERLLCSRLSIDQLLMGKWLYLAALGCLQITLMFVWGSAVFGVDLWGHLGGFALMTAVTSGAAASFALLLATLSSTRVQLGWMSTIIILVMSALGGSMVPRYLMSESVQQVGLLTFNAWALEGYSKIFWRELPLAELELEFAVLLSSSFAMLVGARLAAVRWERG